MSSQHPISDSEFHMWRSVFAFAFTDRALSDPEKSLLHDYRSDVHFSAAQLETLRNDFIHPQNVEAMYRKIVKPEHKQRFCAMARALAWCEGDLTLQEEAILKRVTCLGTAEERNHLSSSRTHPQLFDYYEQYLRNDLAGLWHTPPRLVELRA